MEKENPESEVIKDSPDSPEPLNKKPRLIAEEVQPAERAKGSIFRNYLQEFFNFKVKIIKSELVLRRSRHAPFHVDQPHHCSQFQEAPRVLWSSDFGEQQVRVVSAPERGERVNKSLTFYSLFILKAVNLGFIYLFLIFTGWTFMKMEKPLDNVATDLSHLPFCRG